MSNLLLVNIIIIIIFSELVSIVFIVNNYVYFKTNVSFEMYKWQIDLFCLIPSCLKF